MNNNNYNHNYNNPHNNPPPYGSQVNANAPPPKYFPNPTMFPKAAYLMGMVNKYKIKNSKEIMEQKAEAYKFQQKKQKQKYPTGSLFDKWDSDDNWWLTLSGREFQRHLLAIENIIDQSFSSYEANWFWKSFRIQTWGNLRSLWPTVISREQGLIAHRHYRLMTLKGNQDHNLAQHPSYCHTNFDMALEYLSPIIPRLSLTFHERQLQHHLYSNLSRAGYHHLYNDKRSQYKDPEYGDLVRGHDDLSYILSSKAKRGKQTHMPGQNLHSRIAPYDYNKESFLDSFCAICSHHLQNDSLVIILPCTHVFHKDCIADWLIICSAVCPICKYDLKYICCDGRICD